MPRVSMLVGPQSSNPHPRPTRARLIVPALRARLEQTFAGVVQSMRPYYMEVRRGWVTIRPEFDYDTE